MDGPRVAIVGVLWSVRNAPLYSSFSASAIKNGWFGSYCLIKNSGKRSLTVKEVPAWSKIWICFWGVFWIFINSTTIISWSCWSRLVSFSWIFLQVRAFVQVVAPACTSFLLVSMACDRYYAIVLNTRHNHQNLIMVSTSWLLSILLSLPQLYGFGLNEREGGRSDMLPV